MNEQIDNELKNNILKSFENKKEEILEFFQILVKTKSYTGDEEKVAKLVYKKMLELNYDEVWQDKFGNIIGKIGNGSKSIYFDSHMDTVGVGLENEWKYDPFSAKIVDDKVYGRGTADMKSGLVASIYAAAIVKELGCPKNLTIYIAATVMEEDYDGVATKQLIKSLNTIPNFAIMCEPTCLDVGIGHKGRALTKITINGKSAHGSRPDLGINPTYIMAEILPKIEAWNNELSKLGLENSSVAVTSTQSFSDSFNSIPSSACIYLDHRLCANDSEEKLALRMNEIISGVDATWEICDFPAKTYTNENIMLHSMHTAWQIPKEHILVTNALNSCKAMNRNSQAVKMGFSTNAVSTASYFKIPTLVLGPGDVRFAHMIDEHCSVKDLFDACKIYAYMCKTIL